MVDFKCLLQLYEGNRVIRSLVQLVPLGIGSAVDVALVQTVQKIRIERARTFFDEFVRGNTSIDDALLKSEDFLHCYTLTASLALNSRRKEKIRMFARLLKSSLVASGPSGTDEYEDFLHILDDLSYREIQALKILDELSSDVPRNDDQNDLQWIRVFWDEFEDQLCRHLNIPKEEIADFMLRIARTGCYATLTGTYWESTGAKGVLTPTYRRLKGFIAARETDT